jgi:ankyrin repeat protein
MRYQYGGANLEELWRQFRSKLKERLKEDGSFGHEISEPDVYIDKLTELPQIFIDADPTKNNYIRWIISGYIDGGIAHYEDLYFVKEELDKYERLKKKKLLKGTEKDINNYCGLTGCTKKNKEMEGLYHLLKRYEHVFEKEKEKEIESEIIHSGAKKIFDGTTIKVYEILTAEAACHYGQGTKWCTNTKDPKDPRNRFNAYSKDGPVYIIIPKRPTHAEEKYQIQFESKQFNDELNNNLGIEDFTDKYPEVSKFHLIFAAMKGSVEDVKNTLPSASEKHINRAFITASKNGNLEIVRLLLSPMVGADVHVKNDYAIRLASQEGHLEIVKLLVENGANVSADDDYSLRIASKYGYLEIVQLLLKNGANINAGKGEALREASANEHWEIVKLLIEKGARVNDYNDYALRRASEFGHLEIVKLLIEKGANVNAINGEALRDASRSGHFNVVKLLIEKGANIHAYDDYALRRASEFGNLEIVKLLIENGANVNAENDEALRSASIKGHLEIVKLLLKHGANVNSQSSDSGRTPLINASIEGHLEIVKLLLENGANIRNSKLVNIAVKKGHLEMVRLLLEKGAKVGARDNEALCDAIEIGHFEMVQLLVEYGARVNNNNCHPLNKASAMGNLEIVKFLVKKGANINSISSPIDHASRNGHFEIVKFLVENGAFVQDAFRIASCHRHLEISQWLLENGADVHYENEDALYRAIYNNYPEMVQLLIDYGADFSKVLGTRNYEKYAEIYNKEYFKRVEKDGNLADWEDICRYLNQEYRLPQLKSIANKLGLKHDTKITKKELCELISLDYDAWVKEENKDEKNPRAIIHKKKSIT